MHGYHTLRFISFPANGKAHHVLISMDSDYLAIRNVAFEWAESYDTKDWDRLRRCLAPSIRLDFRALRMALHEHLSPDEFVAIISDAKVIGNPRLKTQHFLGGAQWECLNDGTVQVWHQIRVAHQRYVDDDLAVVANKGHAHGATQHCYRKIDGTWKLEGVTPRLEWTEYDLYGTLNPEDEGGVLTVE